MTNNPPTYEELELQLWQAQFALAHTNAQMAQMIMAELRPKIQARMAELAKPSQEKKNVE